MDDISNLIKEARPLYFAKKKQKEQIKKALLVVFILFSTSMGALGGWGAKEMQVASQNTEITQETVSYEDDMSIYPVDEYGLIAVNY